MNRKEIIKNNYKKKWAKKQNIETKDPAERAYRSRIVDQRTGKPNYTFEEFKKQLESKFVFGEIGWFNYGTWEVDHIKPLTLGGLDEISNLQPLLKTDNRKKSRTKFVPPEED